MATRSFVLFIMNIGLLQEVLHIGELHQTLLNGLQNSIAT